MSRPTIKELYGLDARVLANMKTIDSSVMKLNAIKSKRFYLAEKLRTIPINEHDSYEQVSAINAQLKYIDKTIYGLEQDIQDMGITDTKRLNEIQLESAKSLCDIASKILNREIKVITINSDFNKEAICASQKSTTFRINVETEYLMEYVNG